MSSQTQTFSEATSSTVNDVNGAESSNDTMHLIENFFKIVNAFSSDNIYKNVVRLMEEIPHLRSQVADREKKSKQLEDEIENLKSKHKTVQQESLAVYNDARDTLERELTAERNKVSSLETDVNRRDSTIEDLNQKIDELKKQKQHLEETVDGYKATLKKAKKKVTDLQSEVKENEDKKQESERNLNQERDQVLQLKDEMSQLKEENIFLTQKLESKDTRLTELEGFAEPLREEDIDVSIGKLDGLWESACQLVESYFREDLPIDVLQNQNAWKKLREPRVVQHHVPLPQSNTHAAKKMRVAVILAILARLIDKIFHPTYVLEANSGLRRLLLRQAVVNSKKESFCRGLLLSMFPDEQAEAGKEIVTQVITEMLWYIRDLLPSESLKGFQSDLEQVVKKARDAWLDMQRIKQRFEPNFQCAQAQDPEWQSIRFEEDAGGMGVDVEQGPTRNAESERGEVLLVVFPCFYIVEDHEPDPVTLGVVLRGPQTAAAALELEKDRGSNPAFGRVRSTRSKPSRARKPSISISGAQNGNVGTRNFLQQAIPSGGHSSG